MKKQIILTVTAFFAVMLVLSGCSLGKMGRADSLSNITATPIQQVQPQNNELSPKMDAIIAGLTDLTSAIRNGKNTPVIAGNNHQLKRPKTGAFSKKAKITKTSESKCLIAIKKELSKTNLRLNKTIGRLAKVEDVVSYVHPDIETDSVNTFKPGDSYLTEVAKTYLDKIVERVNKKEVAIKQIIGHADLSPARKGTNNDGIAMHRAEAVAQYLKEKGIDISGIVIRGDGATDKYGSKSKNRRATVILKKLSAAQPVAVLP